MGLFFTILGYFLKRAQFDFLIGDEITYITSYLVLKFLSEEATIPPQTLLLFK